MTEQDERRMHRFTVDYLARDREESSRTRKGTLLDRGYFANGTPRLIPWCQIFGHRPVVDGTGTVGGRGYLSRWVCCDRCGVRPDPQGNLDPDAWDVGQPYPEHLLGHATDLRQHPGPWPKHPTGRVGAQLVLGRTFGGAGVEVKIGNAGSEHVLAAHLRIHPLFALYLHTEQHGTWLQRRLNPVGYQSRVINLDIGDRRIRWQLWARRGESSRDDPKWMHGSIRIDPRDILLGQRRYWHTKTGEPEHRTITLPHGDTHTLTLQLTRREAGRERGQRKHDAWTVDWECRGGIPDGRKPGSSGIWGSAVEISDQAARSDQWPDVAAAKIVAKFAEQRARNGYRPASTP